MCGLHCVNALLQAPIFDEVEMAEIARALDEEERALLDPESVAALEAAGNMGKGVGADGISTTNVANSGNYSIQVLAKALL